MLFKGLPGISRRLHAIADHVPSQCAICHAWPSQRLCPACTARFAQPASRCQRCALRTPEGVAVCGACLQNPPAFDACLTAVDYAYPWADVLADFKFRGDPGWARALSLLMLGAPGIGDAIAAADRVLPMPLSPGRLRERGFNQAALLARHLAPGKADVRTLLRLRATETQSRLPRAQRLRNLQAAFVVEPARAVRMQGTHVALIDDVMTTGATMQAASLALAEAGASRITAIVLARTGLE